MNLSVVWQGGMAFEALPPSGHRFVMDAIPEVGGRNLGPSPIEVLCASAAACSGIDVISILQKKRQTVTAYRVEVKWTRAEEGEWPRPVTEMTVCHVITGENLDPEAVARSVQLSDEKYCSVIATLRIDVKVRSEWQVT